MEYCYRLTIWECIICGIRRAFGKPSFVLLEIIEIYRRCGTKQRTVRIEDGSIFVIGETDTREYLCRNIEEFQKRGKVYWIVMSGKLGNPVQLYLPVRVVGDEKEQTAFWGYLNDQRRISGDKLVIGAAKREKEARAPVSGQGQVLCQRWNLEKLSKACAESLWIQRHYMAERQWKDWGMRNLPFFITFTVLFPMIWYLLNTQTIPIYLALFAMLMFRTSQEWKQGERISMKDIRSQVKSWGSGIYEEQWELSLSPVQIKRKIPLLENTWDWDLVGFLMETEDFYYFFTKQKRLMFYFEKALLGGWMAQKWFVQECQGRGICCQAVQPELVMDIDLKEEGLSDKIRPITKTSDQVRKHRRRGADTQKGWRAFWAGKEKGQGNSDSVRLMIVALGVAAAFLLAFILPEYGGRRELAGMPDAMDMPVEDGAYVIDPESYEGYVSLTEQIEVLESLGFELSEEMAAELNMEMEQTPMSRAWVEGDPYRSLLMRLGMPERDYESWEIKSYPDQAYWFDWEGFDMGMEYIAILNGVNAMANGEFAITEAKQDMSEVDWENGSGVVHVSFCVNGISYEYPMKMKNDWLDAEMIGAVNDALTKAGVEKRVYAMGDGGQGCILMYRDQEWARRFWEKTGIKLE